MLHYLQIENFAIVDQLKLHFNSGLTIISGETGAGKSILIDALGLALGDRADSTLVRQGRETAVVNAVFTLPPAAQEWLQQKKLNNSHECLVRRVINHNGRSRGYINDQPVSVQLLRQLGEQLVDIHGQHAHQSLLKSEVQRQLVDGLAVDNSVLERVAQIYERWKSLRAALDNLGGEDREAKIAFLRYQVEELEGFELTTEALDRLENEHRRLANAQKLLEHSQSALTLLDNDESGSTLSCLSQASHVLEDVQQHDSQLNNITVLLENAIIHTQEAVGELRHYLHHLDIDSASLQEVQQQIATLQDLARKHRVRFTDLPAHFEKLTRELNELENYEENASRLEGELAEVLQDYRVAAEALHQQRVQIAQQLAEKISAEMHRLGMPGGQLVIAVSADEDAPPAATGTDIIEFLVTTNPGHPPKPLQKVASGGELSRISLAIQVVTAQSSGVPILVFDEVDVGIGGGVAEIVGKLLNHLAQQRQVLCITHLPQVACQGDHHLQVNKTINQQSTHAYINVLDNQQRVEEIARMLGGIEITSQTLAHAQEMLQRSTARFPSKAV
ncbi:MAG TPA: DNA repair protein RecN [Thioploca sp.]|nr:MAG: DNA repair protein RecN [Beggiatoa sp. 4572_84]RKZ61033.1 MAG: DNA repair protein RecN [Gammaproteobacteria bacterium]HDN25838.1 DNA repair protein RecN [Thioploca sp.]